MSNQVNIVGNPNSFLLRPLRYLFEHGKTLPQMNSLWFRCDSDEPRPFGMLSLTDANRLIFWPPLPPDMPLLSPDGKKGVIDHITLELSNHKSHTTSFNAKGKRKHFSQQWYLHEFADSGLAQWFSLVLPGSILRAQDRLIEVGVHSPSSDMDRRTEEFRRFAQQVQHLAIPLPPGEPGGDYVYCVFYVCIGGEIAFCKVQESFLTGIDKNVTGFPDGTKFTVAGEKLRIGSCEVLVATATPPGIAQNDVIFGFPSRAIGRT